MRAPDELAPELDRSPLVDGDLLDAAAHTVARLENEDVGSTEGEIACGRQPGEARSDDDDVGHPVAASSSARMRSASAGRCAVTAAPTSYSSTSPEFATSACTRSPPGSETNTCVVDPR